MSTHKIQPHIAASAQLFVELAEQLGEPIPTQIRAMAAAAPKRPERGVQDIMREHIDAITAERDALATEVAQLRAELANRIASLNWALAQVTELEDVNHALGTLEAENEDLKAELDEIGRRADRRPETTKGKHVSKYEIRLSTGEVTTVDGPDMTDQEILRVNWVSETVARETGGVVLTLTRVKPERKPCEAFAWIGQGFDHCDDCGLPYWEHTHDSWRGELRPITAEQALACRRKWDPSFDEAARAT